ncbi:MAG TPA: radical SAM protein [Methanosarcina sp.]|jgi:uncharacterized protein|nr:radical SAM protein [Methanosarcina sp.]
MYYPSKYNHIIQLKAVDGKNFWVLNNLFFGATDIINKDVYEAFIEGEVNGKIPEQYFSNEIWDHFLQKGFVWLDSSSEEDLVQSGAKTYGDRDQIAAGLNGGHYGFITSLHCNLACPYCFQKKKANSYGFLSPRQVDLGIDAINRLEERVMLINNNKKTLPKISITGGEPLLKNKENLEVLDYILEKLGDLRWPYSITTNGTELESFVTDHSPSSNCRNVQVTLDGPRNIHDKRRRSRSGISSFDQIIKGIDAALEDGWKITLRVNLDMNNINYLSELAKFVQTKGWGNFENFSAYASPVTDHGSLGGYDTPKDEADLLLATLETAEKFPIIRQIFDIRHFRGLNYVERILLEKNPKYPVIHRCEAVMGMYIFDPLGDTHVCLEAVGDPSMRVGRYDPEWKLDEKAASRWAQRHVLSIEKCNNCKVRFICAGGCTMESFNKGNNEACMPFLREIDIAWNYYAKKMPELFT